MGRILGSQIGSVVIFLTVAALALAQGPVVAQGGVSNAANGISPVTPGSLISIYGSNLAGGIAVADTIPLSASLNKVSVTINGIPAPLLYVDSPQINAQVPWNVLQSGTSGTATVVVQNGTQMSAAQNVPIGPFSPGIFVIGNNVAVAINNSDGTVAAPSGSIAGVNTRPAKVGDPLGLQIWCTGLGAVDSAIANGAASSDKLRTNTTFPQVLVGGQPATVVWSGLTPYFVGVNQINITLPPGTPTGNAVSLQIVAGGITTSSAVTIAVEGQ
ncbi:MAG TPA: IPT/TIG domain-containing protein [Bryobacteraceae bacterium]|nr:IPT/TIG domain-containing protein [Bryobacteraceae bacterium]